MKDYKLIWVLIFAINATIFSQQVEQIQPTIMVMPFTKSGENALELYENDFKWQSIIARVNNAFQERGFRPKDLQETINQVKKSKAISTLKNANFNVEEAIYMEARTDIIVKAFINIHSEDNNITNTVQVALKAIEASSRMALYDLPTASSPPFKTTDYGYLVDRLLTEENRIETFINGLNDAFTQIITLGKAITVEIIVSEESVFKLGDEKSNSAFISELITEWIQNNAYKNQYRIKQDSENILSFDEVRIPLKTETGANYTVNDFAKILSVAVVNICGDKEGVKAKRPRPSVSEGTIRIILP
jgi:hypothetical protein